MTGTAMVPMCHGRRISKMYRETGTLGEVRELSDWKPLPQGESLRVLALTAAEDAVTRWAADEAIVEYFGCRPPMHDALHRLGDPGSCYTAT